MGFLNRRQKSVTTYLIGGPDDLARIGTTAFGGDTPHPPGWAGVPVGDLDAYALAFLEAAGYPRGGTPEHAAAQGRFLDELAAAAAAGGDWAYVGAFLVARNALVEIEGDPRYLEILDRGLEVLRLDGVAFTAIPPFALDRYQQVHGFDGIFPADWPGTLIDVVVPQPGEEPATEPPADGEARRVAESRPQGLVRQIFAEEREDGRFVAVFEGVVEDGTLARWDWDGCVGPDYPSFLRVLGDRLVTPTPWYHDDLAPYFPCRAKTREELRGEARASRA